VGHLDDGNMLVSINVVSLCSGLASTHKP